MLRIHEDIQINHTFSFDEDLDFLRDEIETQKMNDKLQENDNSNITKSKTSNKKLNKRIPLKILNTKLFSRT